MYSGKEVYKIFDKTPVGIRREEEPYLSREDTEKALYEAFDKSMVAQDDMQYIFVDNKNNPHHLLVYVYKDVDYPHETIWVNYYDDGVDDVGISIQFEQGTEQKPNIVKKTAKELGMNYKELADAIGVSEGSLSNSASTGKITKQLEKSLELLKDNYKMKKDFEIISKFRELLNK